LIATAGNLPNVYKSARNIQNVSISPAAELNALNVLSSRRLLITPEALDQIKERASSSSKGASSSSDSGSGSSDKVASSGAGS